MEAKEFNKYYSCISSIKAEEMLDAFTSSIYPHLKDSRRKSLHSSVNRHIRKVVEVKQKALADFGSTMSKLGAILGR